MAVAVGVCCKGRITRIMPWGAFAELEGSDGAVSGMIHISELSPAYVREISDLVAVGDCVTVKVLRIDERGRIALSRRQAMTEEEQTAERRRLGSGRDRAEPSKNRDRIPVEFSPYVRGENRRAAESSDTDFEEMMRRFRSASEETLGALRRSADGRRTRRKR